MTPGVIMLFIKFKTEEHPMTDTVKKAFTQAAADITGVNVRNVIQNTAQVFLAAAEYLKQLSRGAIDVGTSFNAAQQALKINLKTGPAWGTYTTDVFAQGATLQVNGDGSVLYNDTLYNAQNENDVKTLLQALARNVYFSEKISFPPTTPPENASLEQRVIIDALQEAQAGRDVAHVVAGKLSGRLFDDMQGQFYKDDTVQHSLSRSRSPDIDLTITRGEFAVAQISVDKNGMITVDQQEFNGLDADGIDAAMKKIRKVYTAGVKKTPRPTDDNITLNHNRNTGGSPGNILTRF
jgi:hypothetical protein